jgi:hypothetical protein
MRKTFSKLPCSRGELNQHNFDWRLLADKLLKRDKVITSAYGFLYFEQVETVYFRTVLSLQTFQIIFTYRNTGHHPIFPQVHRKSF